MAELWPKPANKAQMLCRLIACAVFVCLLAEGWQYLQPAPDAPVVAGTDAESTRLLSKLAAAPSGFSPFKAIVAAKTAAGIISAYFLGWKYSRLAALCLLLLFIVLRPVVVSCGCEADKDSVPLLPVLEVLLCAGALAATIKNKKDQGKEVAHG